MAFKTFAVGEVLTAADANTMMRQGVILCTATSRPTSQTNGMVIYETDTGIARQWRASSNLWEPLWIIGARPVTPTLTASTSNPVLGSGAVQKASYEVSAGRLCTYWGQIQFGTSGVNPGSGQYLISLPFQSASAANGPAFPGIGGAIVRQNSGGALRNANVYIASGATTMAILAADQQVTNTAPWTWAAQDYIAWSITYEVDAGLV